MHVCVCVQCKCVCMRVCVWCVCMRVYVCGVCVYVCVRDKHSRSPEITQMHTEANINNLNR